jgi:hypothetical protein
LWGGGLHPPPPPPRPSARPPPQLLYLVLVHLFSSPSASAVGLVVATSTFIKTVLYFLMSYFEGITHIVPSAALATREDVNTFVTLWLIPNGIWVIVPFAVIVALARKLSTANAKAAAATRA